MFRGVGKLWGENPKKKRHENETWKGLKGHGLTLSSVAELNVNNNSGEEEDSIRDVVSWQILKETSFFVEGWSEISTPKMENVYA